MINKQRKVLPKIDRTFDTNLQGDTSLTHPSILRTPRPTRNLACLRSRALTEKHALNEAYIPAKSMLRLPEIKRPKLSNSSTCEFLHKMRSGNSINDRTCLSTFSAGKTAHSVDRFVAVEQKIIKDFSNSMEQTLSLLNAKLNQLHANAKQAIKPKHKVRFAEQLVLLCNNS